MPYLFNTAEDQAAMLAAIGVPSLEALFEQIPRELRLGRSLEIPPALTELELARHIGALAERNAHAGQKTCFLGGGSYDHFIPAVVDALASRGEFYTSYTPYQPEVSQGNLQVMFEYQTLICQLTGLDVSNASLYDGASAAVEGVLMCRSATRRSGKVVVAAGVHPEYRQTLATYFANLDSEIVTVGAPGGRCSLEDLSAAVDDQTACVLVQHPNFFGCLEDVERIGQLARERGALLVVAFDPISLGVLKRPGDLGADVAVAEGQSLGSPMSYGGPYLGIIACREEFIRRLPGRIAGETTAAGGRRCYVLTLQTREQHIRREKATSNICTNQGLYALRASIFLAVMGPQGLREAANLCAQKAHYAASQIETGGRCRLRFNSPFFKEFVLQDRQGRVADLLAGTEQSNVLAGLPLGRWYPDLADCLLVSVTEKRSREEIETLARLLSAA